MTKFPIIWYNAGLNYAAESYINHLKPSGNYTYHLLWHKKLSILPHRGFTCFMRLLKQTAMIYLTINLNKNILEISIIDITALFIICSMLVCS